MADKDRYLFDNPRNVQFLLYGLYTCCALLFVLDFIFHRHTLHSWEKLLGFYAVYGFVGCVLLVIVAKWLRLTLMRDEDYYDQDGQPADEHPRKEDHVAE